MSHCLWIHFKQNNSDQEDHDGRTSLLHSTLQVLPSLHRIPHTLFNSTVRMMWHSVQWQPPLYDGGASVDNYTITVTPGGSTLTIPGTSILYTLSYNLIHTVSIVATNCNGSSSAVMETIRIGKPVHCVTTWCCTDICCLWTKLSVMYTVQGVVGVSAHMRCG